MAIANCKRWTTLMLVGALAFNGLGCRQAETLAKKQSPSSALFASRQEPETPPADAKRDVAFTIARSLEAEGNTQKAIQAYQSVVDAYEMPAAYHRLAVLHDLREDFEKSAEYYREALRREPKNAKVLCDLGYSYYLQERLPESESVLRQAVALSPADPLAHNNLGLVLGAAGRFEEAFEHFAAVSASKAEARVNLSYTMLRNQRIDEAERQLQLALREDPELSAARSLLASLSQQDKLDASQEAAEYATASVLSRQRSSNVQPAAASAAQTQLKMHPQPVLQGSPSRNNAPMRLPQVPEEAPSSPRPMRHTDQMVRKASATASTASDKLATQVSIITKEAPDPDAIGTSVNGASATPSVVAEEYATHSRGRRPDANGGSGREAGSQAAFDPFE